MKVLVAYKSETGFTKKYARWISEDLIANFTRRDNINKIVTYIHSLEIE